jgi:hypothetical protein
MSTTIMGTLILSDFLNDFIAERDHYDDDLNDAIHNFSEDSAGQMNKKGQEEIIKSRGGVFKCIAEYISKCGEIDFNDSEENINDKLIYICIHNYILRNYIGK